MAKTVMIVDDSKTLRHVVGTALDKAGYRSLGAVDGEDALEKLGKEKVDMIICDVYMPKMDGITLLKEIKNRQEYSQLPVLMLTTESQAGKMEEARSAGATGWITKPFTSQQLLNAVERIAP
jgi:two-component system chemotaxis response regulator CheY